MPSSTTANHGAAPAPKPNQAVVLMTTGTPFGASRAIPRRGSVEGSGVTITTGVPASSGLLSPKPLQYIRHGLHPPDRKATRWRPSATSTSVGEPSGAVPEMQPATAARYRCGAATGVDANVSPVRIGVIGGTGPAGQAVAVQLAGIGEEVVVGSRSHERAEGIVAELHDRWTGRGLPLLPGDNAAAAESDVVVVATPWEGVLSTVGPLKEALAGKLVITMVNALTRWGQMIPLTVPTGSVTAALALALPAARVTGAFHHLPAEQWADLDHPIDADVLVCAERRADAREVVALCDRLPGLRGVDAGGLGSALAIEALTPLLIGVNIRYKAHTAIRLSGLPEKEGQGGH